MKNLGSETIPSTVHRPRVRRDLARQLGRWTIRTLGSYWLDRGRPISISFEADSPPRMERKGRLGGVFWRLSRPMNTFSPANCVPRLANVGHADANYSTGVEAFFDRFEGRRELVVDIKGSRGSVPTIGAALAQMKAADRIRVLPGKYTVDIISKSIEIIAHEPNSVVLTGKIQIASDQGMVLFQGIRIEPPPSENIAIEAVDGTLALVRCEILGEVAMSGHQLRKRPAAAASKVDHITNILDRAAAKPKPKNSAEEVANAVEFFGGLLIGAIASDDGQKPEQVMEEVPAKAWLHAEDCFFKTLSHTAVSGIKGAQVTISHSRFGTGGVVGVDSSIAVRGCDFEEALHAGILARRCAVVLEDSQLSGRKYGMLVARCPSVSVKNVLFNECKWGLLAAEIDDEERITTHQLDPDMSVTVEGSKLIQASNGGRALYAQGQRVKVADCEIAGSLLVDHCKLELHRCYIHGGDEAVKSTASAVTIQCSSLNGPNRGDLFMDGGSLHAEASTFQSQGATSITIVNTTEVLFEGCEFLRAIIIGADYFREPSDPRFFKAGTMAQVEEWTPNMDAEAANTGHETKTVAASKESEIGSIDAVFSDLNRMTGLHEVKRDVQAMFLRIRGVEKRRKAGFPVSDVSHHTIFTGRPGTGKTTIAKMMGRAYKALGILKKGHVVECSRSSLVEGYIGQTAPKTRKKLEEAMGGILFVDEAYTLMPVDSSRDVGKEAIEEILAFMENHRDELIVIAAGYETEMVRFVEANPGLKSRFTKFIKFEDYTPPELAAIFEGLSEKDGMAMTDDFKRRLLLSLHLMHERKDGTFGNGRDVRNLFEKCQGRYLERLSRGAAADSPFEVMDLHTPFAAEIDAIMKGPPEFVSVCRGCKQELPWSPSARTIFKCSCQGGEEYAQWGIWKAGTFYRAFTQEVGTPI